MAEIRLKKRKKPLWPWAVGLIIVLTLSWGVLESLRYKGRTDETAAVGLEHDAGQARKSREFAYESEDGGQSRNERDIKEFVRFSKNAEVYGAGNVYEAEGLLKLASALEALSVEAGVENGDVARKLTALKSRSDYILMHGNEHGDSARVAMTEAVDIFKIIQQEIDPADSELVQALDEAITRYKPSEAEDIHKRQMENFFEESAMAVGILWDRNENKQRL